MSKKPRLLLAEDEENISFAAMLALKSAGYQVDVAGDGGAALEKAIKANEAGNPYDAMVLDVHMPYVTGVELLRSLKTRGIYIPALAITGFGSKEVVVELFMNGCADYLDKPFDMEELVTRVGYLVEPRVQNAGGQPREANTKDAGPLTARETEGWQEVTPHGDMSMTTADSLRALLVEKVEKGCKRFRFDLGRVKSIDAMVLSLFFSFGRMMSEMGGKPSLEVVNLNEDMALLFRKTRLDEHFVLKA